MELDLDRCYQALTARDARFDGAFFVGVRSTGIYCRPVCSARTPRKSSCDFFPHPASAERAGFRPCLRCRPELAPGLAPMDAVRRVAQRAAARIDAGALNERDLEALAAEFSLSSRQLRRVIEHEYGVTPVELAQTRRLLLAKQLLSESQLPVARIAFASGFASLRRFNHLFQSRYGLNPTALRRGQAPRAGTEHLTLQLHYRPPLAWDRLAGFLASRGAPGVEALDGARYLRTAEIGTHRGWFSVQPAASIAKAADSTAQRALRLEVSNSLLPVLTPLLAKLRALLDLDANPRAIDAHLAQDTRLRPLVDKRPGLRVPGTFHGFDLALRAVLGQQVTVKAATTIYGRFAAAFGAPLTTPHAALTRLAPAAAAVAEASIDRIAGLGVPGARAQTIRALAAAVAEGRLDLEAGADPQAARETMLALPGIGDWTAQYVAMRALRDPDAFPASDLGVLRALEVKNARQALAASEPWRPWRAYAVMHLWQSGAGG